MVNNSYLCSRKLKAYEPNGANKSNRKDEVKNLNEIITKKIIH